MRAPVPALFAARARRCGRGQSHCLSRRGKRDVRLAGAEEFDGEQARDQLGTRWLPAPPCAPPRLSVASSRAFARRSSRLKTSPGPWVGCSPGAILGWPCLSCLRGIARQQALADVDALSRVVLDNCVPQQRHTTRPSGGEGRTCALLGRRSVCPRHRRRRSGRLRGRVVRSLPRLRPTAAAHGPTRNAVATLRFCLSTDASSGREPIAGRRTPARRPERASAAWSRTRPVPATSERLE
jgi:hypothetical protein